MIYLHVQVRSLFLSYLVCCEMVIGKSVRKKFLEVLGHRGLKNNASANQACFSNILIGKQSCRRRFEGLTPTLSKFQSKPRPRTEKTAWRDEINNQDDTNRNSASTSTLTTTGAVIITRFISPPSASATTDRWISFVI